MATISTRINSSGTYLVNGTFDEITYSRISPVIKNLLIYTDSFDNVNWGKGSVSITANSTTAPDGTIVADTIVENTTPSSYHFINQSFNKTATANTYTYSIYAKDAGRSGLGLRIDNNAGSGAVVTYNVATGATISGAGTYGSFTSASSNILSVGNGWYRISLTATTDASTTVAFVQNYLHSIPAGTTVYTGDGISGIYIWGAQIEQNSTVTIYQGIAASSTLVTPTFKNKVTSDAVYVTDIFDEVTYNTTSPAIKNLIQYTEQLDNAYWIISDVLPVTANATIAPDGTLTADKVTENTATSITHFIRSTGILISSSTQYTWSIYAKAGERTFIDVALGTSSFWVNSSRSATFNLTTGAIVAVSASPLVASITPAGNGWYRCSITATSAATSGMSSNGSVRLCNASASNTYNGDGVSGVFLWGGQLEQNSTLTIYQGIAAANILVTPEFAKREASDGTVYVTGSFDEVTGIS
jgi:hypothetical protein